MGRNGRVVRSWWYLRLTISLEEIDELLWLDVLQCDVFVKFTESFWNLIQPKIQPGWTFFGDCEFFTQNLLFAFFWKDHRNSMCAQILGLLLSFLCFWMLLMTPSPQAYILFKTTYSSTLSKNNNMLCIVLLIKLPTWIAMKLGQCSNIDNEKYIDYWFIEIRNILIPRNFITLKQQIIM